MRFTTSALTVTGLSVAGLCASHVQWAALTGSSATASRGLTLDVLEFRGKVSGAFVDWTASGTGTTAIPDAQPISGGAGTIAGPITITIAQLSAPLLNVTGLTTLAQIC